MKTLAEMRAELLAKRAGQYDSAAGSGVAGGQAVRHTAQLVATDIVTGAGVLASLVRGFYVGLTTRTEPQPGVRLGWTEGCPRTSSNHVNVNPWGTGDDHRGPRN